MIHPGIISWLQSLPIGRMALVLVGGTTLGAVGVVQLVHHKVPREKLQANHEVAGVFFSIVGVMYAIILAFMVFAVWDNFQNADRIAEDEATTLDSLYRDAVQFEGDGGNRLRRSLVTYGTTIVQQEWPAMAHRDSSPQVDKDLDQVWSAFQVLDPKTEQQKAFYTEMTHNLNQLHTLRHERLLISREGLPFLLWIVVFAGGATTLSYVIYFGQTNFRPQMWMTVTLAVSISFVVLVVLALDNPFAGDVRVHPDALATILHDIASGR